MADSICLLLTGAVLLLLAVLLPALSLVLTDCSNTWELVSILQGSVTAFAILAGGFFAAYKLEVFRDFAPHLTITHAITHRAVGDSYVYISVSVTLHNSLRVKVDIVGGIFRLYQLVPLYDEEVEQLYAELISSSDTLEVKWPMLYELEFSKGEDEIFVEPGELYQEAIDFLVSIDTKSVVVYTYFGDGDAQGCLKTGTGGV